MTWDRSWLHLERTNDRYVEGCEGFVELAFDHSAINDKIRCPCRNCINKKIHDKDSVLLHLLTKGWSQDYAGLERWYLHNEPRQQPLPDRNHNKEFRKIDALDAPEGEQPTPRMRGKPVSTHAESLGLQLEKYYDAAIAEGSDDSTANTQAAQATFGRVTRLGLLAPRGTRPARRDAYTAQLEQHVQTANQRIATLEASQREMQRILAQLLARQQGGDDDGTEGGSNNGTEGGGNDGTKGGDDGDT